MKCILKLRLKLFFPILLLANPLCVFAAPDVSIAFQVLERGSHIIFTITPSGSAAGCHYNFFAERTKQALKEKLAINAIRIATFGRDEGPVDIEAVEMTALRTLDSENRPAPGYFHVFFRLWTTCEDQSESFSPIYRLTLRRKHNGPITSVRRWILQMKYSMRYVVG